MSPSSADNAFQQLIAAFGGRVRALVVQHCAGNQGLDPDDLEQEVRIRLWKALQSDRIEGLGASYVQRVVLTVVVDAVRRATVRAADPLPEDPSAHEALLAPRGPESEAGERERLVLLERAIAALPARRRQPLRLHLQGFSLQEIADLVGTSAEAARKLVARGLDELRDQLRRVGIDDDA